LFLILLLRVRLLCIYLFFRTIAHENDTVTTKYCTYFTYGIFVALGFLWKLTIDSYLVYTCSNCFKGIVLSTINHDVT